MDKAVDLADVDHEHKRKKKWNMSAMSNLYAREGLTDSSKTMH